MLGTTLLKIAVSLISFSFNLLYSEETVSPKISTAPSSSKPTTEACLLITSSLVIGTKLE
jgi:hypothetical protein